MRVGKLFFHYGHIWLVVVFVWGQICFRWPAFMQQLAAACLKKRLYIYSTSGVVIHAAKEHSSAEKKPNSARQVLLQRTTTRRRSRQIFVVVVVFSINRKLSRKRSQESAEPRRQMARKNSLTLGIVREEKRRLRRGFVSVTDTRSPMNETISFCLRD